MAKKKRLIDFEPGLLVGVDENGLGARLGPLVVTGVRARVSEAGLARLQKGLGKRIRADLDDSKVLVSNKDYRLGEAWARALVERTSGIRPSSPTELFESLSLEARTARDENCPPSALKQCSFSEREAFVSDDELLARIRGHLETLDSQGISLDGVRTYRVCTGELNRLRKLGINRFSADLHGMEKLVLGFLPQDGEKVPFTATCGKVGGMAQYSRFFGPLGGRLHTALCETAAESAYSFPGLGVISFLRDADASDPLVMMASLVGKYVRELLMGRIARFYLAGDTADLPSGYHDPVTSIFVDQTLPVRRSLAIVDACFERDRELKEAKDEPPLALKSKKKKAAVPAPSSGQESLFE